MSNCWHNHHEVHFVSTYANFSWRQWHYQPSLAGFDRVYVILNAKAYFLTMNNFLPNFLCGYPTKKRLWLFIAGLLFSKMLEENRPLHTNLGLMLSLHSTLHCMISSIFLRIIYFGYKDKNKLIVRKDTSWHIFLSNGR